MHGAEIPRPVSREFLPEQAHGAAAVAELLVTTLTPLDARYARQPGTYMIAYRGTLDLYQRLLAGGETIADGGWPIYIGKTADLRERFGRHRRSLAAHPTIRADDLHAAVLGTASAAVHAKRSAYGYDTPQVGCVDMDDVGNSVHGLRTLTAVAPQLAAFARVRVGRCQDSISSMPYLASRRTGSRPRVNTITDSIAGDEVDAVGLEERRAAIRDSLSRPARQSLLSLTLGYGYPGVSAHHVGSVLMVPRLCGPPKVAAPAKSASVPEVPSASSGEADADEKGSHA